MAMHHTCLVCHTDVRNSSSVLLITHKMGTSPPRLQTVYLQDLFQFCKRDMIDRCHGVSRRFNHVFITTAEAHLPKRRFEMLIQTVVSSVYELTGRRSH